MNQSLFKNVLVVVFLMAMAIPYCLHPSQDLPSPVNHDEAAFHLNAKDIVLFGTSSLKDDRLTGILFPLQSLLGLISFSIFGCSIFSLRVLYVFLNILGNVLFFDLIRRTRGLFTASVVLAAFAFYTPRLIIGKAAMAESLTLPLVLILIWCFIYAFRSTRSYFWMGVLGALILCTKLDNVFIPLFLTAFMGIESFRSWRERDLHRAKRIIMFYLSGAGLAILVWLGFYLVVGWQKFLFYLKYVLRPNLNVLSYWNWEKLSPFTIKLFLKNIKYVYIAYPGLIVLTVICLVPFFALLISSKSERRNPLSWAILLLAFLFLGKLLASSIFATQRFAPCYPLPFLLVAYIVGFLMQKLNANIIRTLKNCFAFIFLFMSFYICYLPNMLRWSWGIIFSPSYNVLNESRIIDSIFDKRYKALFLDGRFAYIALQLPVKFIDIPPDLSATEFYQVETNPPLARKLISENPDIGYVFFRPDNKIIKKIIEQEFSGELIARNVAGYGLLYRLPRAN
ncbi:MAG: hypothetical protein KKD11_05880 [Candidatus Omnitrophica bacterium]|nr:hypothetical protein [Candidatus Omnitrophota bacterium]